MIYNFSLFCFCCPLFFWFFFDAGSTAAGIIHPALKFVVDIQTGRIHGQTGIADSCIGVRSLASQLTGRADVDAAAAETALFRTDVERSRYFPFVPSILKTDGPAIHLLSTHPDAKTTEDAFFVPYLKPDLFHSEFRSQVLDDFRIRSYGKH
jgi:hypothetical protein